MSGETEEKTAACEGCGRPMPPSRRETRPTGAAGHLTPSEVGRIRALILCGKSDAEIAEQFRVTPLTVWKIRTRRTWNAR